MSTCNQRISKRILALGLGLVLLGPAAAARADDELADLSLEELLAAQLNAMGISGIHHTHERGEWMVGYGFMHMKMDGNRDATHKVGTSEVLNDYMVAPTEMDMEMHMLHLMYAPARRITLMAMVPYLRMSMDHVNRMGVEFTTRSDGLGDIAVKALVDLHRVEGHRFVLNAGLSAPTGSIDETDTTPMGKVRLPYPMQLGSGTWALQPGFTYLGQSDYFSWGAFGGATIQMGRNGNGYRKGHSGDVTTWLARRLTSFLSASLRFDGKIWGNIQGSDSALNPMMVPTADPNLREGRRVDVVFGMNLFQLEGRLAGNRISAEWGFPIYEWLQGPQLELDRRLGLAWDWTF